MGGSLNRRAVLQSGALAAGSWALGGALRADPARASAASGVAETAPPITGGLVAWLVIDAGRGASLRLAELDATRRPVREIATATFPAASVTAACGEANARVIAATARSWQVASSECGIGHGRILHPASGRSVPYAVWIDFA